jgi:hypothetical protein
MSAPAASESDFINLIREHGLETTAKILNISVRNVHNRRRSLEAKLGILIETPNRRGAKPSEEYPWRLNVDIENGTAIIGSDAHYWPGIVSTAHRAFVKACAELPNVRFVSLNGDVFDGSSISRHPPIGWENRPSVIQEIEACQERLGEIEAALAKRGGHIRRGWNLGNHDARFETRLATVAPEYAKVHGVHLKDHFPTWETAWSTWINDDVVIKHRYKGGIHATHNNTVNAGKTIVTGHLHSLKVTPFSDYNGPRWGVDTGTLAQVKGPQFIDYLEDNPTNWRSGFVVLTFHEGRLLWPDVVHVIDEQEGLVSFQGRVWRV